MAKDEAKLTLSVVSGGFHDKAKCEKETTFLPEPVVLDLKDGGALRDFFRSRIHSVWKFDGVRNGQNTVAMLALALDFDNKVGGRRAAKDKLMTVEKAVERFKDYAGVVHTTTNHSGDWPRLRVLLALESPIVDKGAFKAICTWCKRRWPDADRQVFKVSQPLFPCCEYDKGKPTSGFPLFDLRMLDGVPFKFPSEALAAAPSKAKDAAPDGAEANAFAKKDQVELDALLAWYPDNPITEGERDDELVHMCAKYRQCGQKREEAYASMCAFNKGYVLPPYKENGTPDGKDKTIRSLVDYVYDKQINPPEPRNWPSLRAALSAERLRHFTSTEADASKRLLPHPQFFFDDSMWYSFRDDNGKKYYVGRDECLDESEAAQRGMRFRKERSTRSGLPAATVRDYLLKKVSVSPVEIYRDVRAYFGDYVMMYEPLNLDFIALYVMATYSFMGWDAFPYGSIRGPKESGKTFLMELIASIAFNGETPEALTPASLRDVVDAELSTVCYDEAENLRGRNRDENAIDALRILNLGYKKTGAVTKQVPIKDGGFRPMRYSCYSPKVLGHIAPLAPMLRSRCHGIRMEAMLPEEQEKYLKYQSSRNSIRDREQAIRNGLYVFTLQNFHQPLSVVPSATHIVGRQYEIWAPIFNIAEIVDDNCTRTVGHEVNDCVDAMTRLQRISQKDTSKAATAEDRQSALLIALYRMVMDGSTANMQLMDDRFSEGMVAYLAQSVYSYIRYDCSWLDTAQSQMGWLTKDIVDLGFEARRLRVKPHADKRTIYCFDKGRLVDLAKRRMSSLVEMEKEERGDDDNG